MTLEKDGIISLDKCHRTAAGSLQYKLRNFGIKIAHDCRDIAVSPTGFFFEMRMYHTVLKSTFSVGTMVRIVLQ